MIEKIDQLYKEKKVNHVDIHDMLLEILDKKISSRKKINFEKIFRNSFK